MTQIRIFTLVAAGLLFAVGCSKRALVEIPARVDLQPYDVVGIVEFTSDAEGNLAAFTTQRFIQALQESQPGVRVLELGGESELRQSLETDELDFTAIRAIGEQYGVDVVVVGELVVSNVRPSIDLSTMVTTMSASAKVDASLTTRLFETARGATLWTKSTRGTRTVAHVGLGRGGSVRFDAEDPEKAYGELVDALIFDVTRDFRVTYARQ
jgi:hypothetical protein